MGGRVGDREYGIEDGGQVEGVYWTRERRRDDSSRLWEARRVLCEGSKQQATWSVHVQACTVWIQ
jgi:hypothetical protein